MPNGIATNAVPPWSDPGVDYVRVAAPAVSVAAPAPTPAPELRLNIDHDPSSGSFVYKFVDLATGK